MLESKLCSLPGGGGQEKFKIKAKLSPAEARAKLGNRSTGTPCYDIITRNAVQEVKGVEWG